jgi:RNA polymerase sigma-70 factor (ECF subfamily)
MPRNRHLVEKIHDTPPVPANAEIRAEIERVHRDEWGRVVATLIRLTGDFDVAEDAAQEAFAAAVEQWPRDGVPRSPRAWIVRTAYYKAIDRIRRQTRFQTKRREMRVPAVDE